MCHWTKRNCPETSLLHRFFGVALRRKADKTSHKKGINFFGACGALKTLICGQIFSFAIHDLLTRPWPARPRTRQRAKNRTLLYCGRTKMVVLQIRYLREFWWYEKTFYIKR
jgi:hypothetical protein